jgi:thiosulfate reductase cytochrome b subunit
MDEEAPKPAVAAADDAGEPATASVPPANQDPGGESKVEPVEALRSGLNESTGGDGEVNQEIAEPPPAPCATIRLEMKHPLAIRWMHWINFPVLFTMIWSGLLIYWNDSDNAYQHPHAVYRVGVGPATLLRMFPAWFYTNRFWDMRYHVTEGLGYHFFFMWIFAINGICYVLYLALSGEWRYMVPTVRTIRGVAREAIQVTLYDLHLSKVHPPERKFNGAQKITYTVVILMGAGMLVTGLSIYKPTQLHWLTTLLGGYEMARWEHFWITMGFCGFFLVHVGQVVKTGWNNFRGMVSGWEIRSADAVPYVEEGRDA